MLNTLTEENKVINTVNEALADHIGQQKYRVWFKDSTRMSLTDGYLKIDVPNSFIANWLENHFAEHICHAVQKATDTNVKLVFNIDPNLSANQNTKQIDRQATHAKKTPANKPRRSTESKKLQLTLDTFVVGPSNELAYNAAKAVVNEPESPFNPLFIHGGYGIGKTHLLQGICNAVCQSRPQTSWLYLSAEEFVNEFVLALKSRKQEAFRQRMRNTDLLAIDDIHFLANKDHMQEEFLHTFNTIDMAGKQVVLVSDAHPKMIGELSDKLVNRFVSGMVVKIAPPDYQTRLGICRQFVKKMGKRIPEQALEFVAEIVKSNVRELEGAVLKLAVLSDINNGRINLEMARQVLSDHVAKIEPVINVSDIENVTATFFGTTPADIHSSNKARQVTLARHFSIYLARKRTQMSSIEIGRCMGKKNHATVLMACKKIEEAVKNNRDINWKSPNGNRIAKAKTILTQLEDELTK